MFEFVYNFVTCVAVSFAVAVVVVVLSSCSYTINSSNEIIIVQLVFFDMRENASA